MRLYLMEIFVKIKIIFLFLAVLTTQQVTAGWWQRADRMRQAANTQQLRLLENYIAQHPQSRVVVVTDLHDVALNRVPGDFTRFRALPWSVRLSFLKRIVPFGLRYLCYKCYLPVDKPHIERDVLARLTPEQQLMLLPLVSPFKFDEIMYSWYRRCSCPVVAFSNVGIKSLNYLQQQFVKQMAVFKAIQCSGPDVQYRQKHQDQRYRDLVPFLEHKLGYKPEAVFFIDDRKTCIELGKRVLARENIKTFAYQFKTAAEFAVDLHKYAPCL